MDAVERACALIGTRFRLQGRRAETGLDCVGVILSSFELDPALFPSDYGLRAHVLCDLATFLEPHFRRVSNSAARLGDVLLLRCAPDRLHLALHSGDRLIEANASVGRVVERPLPAEWPILRVYRRRTRKIS